MTKSIKNFGARLREIREKRGLSASDLARLTGVTPAAVSNWENKGTEPQSKALNALAVTLGVTKEWLQTGDDAAQASPPSLPKGTLEGFSLDEILREVDRRGFTVSVSPKVA